MSNRFAVEPAERAAVEEVAVRGEHFVTNDGVEVAHLDGPIVPAEFNIRLRHGPRVCAVVPILIPAVVLVAEGLGGKGLGAVDDIPAVTPVTAAAVGLGFLLDIEVGL